MGASKNLKQAYQRQNDITTSTQNLGNTLTGDATNAFNQRASLIQKPTDFYTSMASGDYNKMLAAAAPAISNISKGAQSAIGAIQDTVPAGAARQFSIAQIQRDKFAKNADFLNQAYMSSFPALQGIATDTGNFGLQQMAGGLNSLGAASQGNQQIIQSETARKQAKMNMIGSIAGMAGGAAMSGLGGLFKGSGPRSTGAGIPLMSMGQASGAAVPSSMMNWAGVAGPNYSDAISLPGNVG